jgi:hypothetical protein
MGASAMSDLRVLADQPGLFGMARSPPGRRRAGAGGRHERVLVRIATARAAARAAVWADPVFCHRYRRVLIEAGLG